MFSIKRFEDYSMNESKDEVNKFVSRKIDQIELKLKKLFTSDTFERGEVIKGETESETEDSDFFNTLNFESLEKSKFSKTHKSIKLIYSDDEFRYDVTFTINFEDIMSSEGVDLDPDTITECEVEFKRYDLEEHSSLLGSLDKKVQIDDINGTLFQELLVELDKEFPTGREGEEFSIETE